MQDLALLTDLYEITMMQGYYQEGIAERRVVFDLFFRSPPFDGGLTIAAGLEQAIDYITQLRFREEDLNYLRKTGLFDEAFLRHLRGFRFAGHVDAVPEGSVVFPQEPLVRIQAGLLEAQLLESALLNIINFQTLIATKAARIVQAAQGDQVIEFGLRRAQGPDAAVWGARASYIAGCTATSNVLAGYRYGIPVRGTHAHSWVQAFPTELEAFQAYARAFPKNCLLLVDTYNVMKSGIPNALKVADTLRKDGHKFVGIRLDSGDLAYLSTWARKRLDEAGFSDATILASGDLDEYLIREIKNQGAAIDAWGVGTRLITAYDDPALGGVYKLVAKEIDGVLHPELKISENPAKITNPGIKQVARLYTSDGKRAVADLLMLHDEKLDTDAPLTIFHPDYTWKRKTLERFSCRPLLIPVIRDGQCVYSLPSLEQVRQYCQEELSSFSPEHRRLVNAHTYFVDLSLSLWQLKQDLLRQGGAHYQDTHPLA